MKIMQRMFLMFGFASIFFAYQFDAISADRRVVSRAVISVPTTASTTNKTNINGNIFASCTNGKIYCAPGKYIKNRTARSCNGDCEPGYACSGGCISTSSGSNFGRTRCTGRDYSAGTNQAKCEECPANARLITDIKTGLNTGCVYPTEPVNGNGSGAGNAGRENGLQYYTAIYDCGEASLLGNKKPTVNVEFNKTFTVADVKDVCDLPAKKEFLNWKIDGTNTTVKSGGIITWIWKANKKIIAQWKDKPGSTNSTYNISYHNLMDATWPNGQAHPNQYTKGVGATIGVPQRNGFTFAGWCVNASGCQNYANYVSGYTISKTQTGNINLYANWNSNNTQPVTRIITYDCADGTSSERSRSSNVTQGDSVKIENNIPWCVRDGWTFDKWQSDHDLQTESGNGKPKYAVNEVVTYKYKGDAKLTATWTQQQNPPADKTYTVTYMVGKCTEYDENYIVYTHENVSGDTAYVVPDNANEKIKGLIDGDKFTFKGWNEKPGQTSSNFPKSDWKPNGNKKVYAVCVEKDNPDVDVTYTITYRCGSCGSSTCQDKSDIATADQDYTILDEIKEYMVNNIKPGYTFVGWNTQPGNTTSNVSESWTPTEDRTIYVACKSDLPAYKYTITYNCGGGTGTPNSQTNIEYGDNVTVLPSTVCSKSEKTFTQWVKNGDDAVKFNAGDTYEWTFGNLTLKPDWQDATGNERNCPAGRYLPQKNSQNPSPQCTQCLAGYYCPGIKAEPITTQSLGIFECPDGEYQSATGQSECIPCSGTVSSNRTICDTGSEPDPTLVCGVKYHCNNGTAEPYVDNENHTFVTQHAYLCGAPQGKEFAGWKLQGTSTVLQAGVTTQCSQDVMEFVAQWSDIQTDLTFVEGVSVTCGEGEWLPKGKSECYDCGDNPDYFCPGGTYKTSASKYKGIYECLNGGTQNSAGTGCTVKFDANDLLYGINGDANCWLEKDATDYKNCVFGGAQKAR